ncbi:MAG: hypothetical protein JSS20_15865 [Proteobacteria bacterium]|nr:hypothetical protein [Pseudomonadota bacterium]
MEIMERLAAAAFALLAVLFAIASSCEAQPVPFPPGMDPQSLIARADEGSTAGPGGQYFKATYTCNQNGTFENGSFDHIFLTQDSPNANLVLSFVNNPDRVVSQTVVGNEAFCTFGGSGPGMYAQTGIYVTTGRWTSGSDDLAVVRVPEQAWSGNYNELWRREPANGSSMLPTLWHGYTRSPKPTGGTGGNWTQYSTSVILPRSMLMRLEAGWFQICGQPGKPC